MTKPCKFVVRATNKETGETWLIYKGVEFDDYDKACIEAAGCEKMWPNIKYEVEPVVEPVNPNEDGEQ